MLGNQLSGNHADHITLTIYRQSQLFQTHRLDVYGLEQVFAWDNRMRLHLPDIFFPRTDVGNGNRFQIIQQNQICLPSHPDGSQMAEAIGAGGVDGSHLNGLDGRNSERNSPADMVADVAFPADILNVLVVGTKAEGIGIHPMSHNPSNNII